MDTKVYDETKQRMTKALDAFRHELSKLRTGRASISILDGVRAEYYGNLTPLNQLATMGTPDSRTIVIQPWDQSSLQAIEKAIQKSDLGLNPVNDGRLIRLPIPPLNEERRKDLVKIIKKHGEECKVSIRNARRDSLVLMKKMEDESKITEDDLKKGETQIQRLTDDFIKQIDDTAAHKEKDIMEV
jgi:ribosome recycling factor